MEVNQLRYNIKINTDFKDFYDKDCENPTIIYNRYKGSSLGKKKQLELLKNIGIKAIELKSVINTISDKVIVYTDINSPDGGSVVMNYNEAVMMYPNSLASKYYTDTENIINKLLYIGSRRFSIVLKETKTGKEILNIKEVASMLNFGVGLPIFSIDYISTGMEMLAIGINTVECLSDYNLERYITKEEIYMELYKSIKYNNTDIIKMGE